MRDAGCGRGQFPEETRQVHGDCSARAECGVRERGWTTPEAGSRDRRLCQASGEGCLAQHPLSPRPQLFLYLCGLCFVTTVLKLHFVSLSMCVCVFVGYKCATDFGALVFDPSAHTGGPVMSEFKASATERAVGEGSCGGGSCGGGSSWALSPFLR